MPSLERQIDSAIRGGVRYVLARQARDGFWRDYDLPPGPSDVWATAWIGRCLCECRVQEPALRSARYRAVRAVASAVVRGGWGYNRSTGADADSTAWACRLFAAHNVPVAAMAAESLEAYVDTGGGAHTFRESGVGDWGGAHADVTALVGLALAEVGGPASRLIPDLRRRVISDQRTDGTWTTFWWETNAYATAWSLVFLAATVGGIPAETAALARNALGGATADASMTAMERSLLLIAWTKVDPEATATLDLLDSLLGTQLAHGEWAPSALLLVPERYPGAQASRPAANADGNALMTTALTCAALAAVRPG